MTVFPSNVTYVYCAACAPGGLGLPHVCGFGQSVSAGKTWPVVHPTPPMPCDHCFCLKQKAGWYDVPAPTSTWPYGTKRQHLKPHLICCHCGGKRLKTQESA